MSEEKGESRDLEENDNDQRSHQSLNRPLLVTTTSTVIQLTPATPCTPSPGSEDAIGGFKQPQATDSSKSQSVINSDSESKPPQGLKSSFDTSNLANNNEPSETSPMLLSSRKQVFKKDPSNALNQLPEARKASLGSDSNSKPKNRQARESRTHSLSILAHGADQDKKANEDASAWIRYSEYPLHNARNIWKLGGRSLARMVPSKVAKESHRRGDSRGSSSQVESKSSKPLANFQGHSIESRTRQLNQNETDRDPYSNWIKKDSISSEPTGADVESGHVNASRDQPEPMASGSQRVDQRRRPSTFNDVRDPSGKPQISSTTTLKMPQFNGSSRCILNIGGVKHEILWSTLLKVPKTRLWRLAYTVCFLFKPQSKALHSAISREESPTSQKISLNQTAHSSSQTQLNQLLKGPKAASSISFQALNKRHDLICKCHSNAEISKTELINSQCDPVEVASQGQSITNDSSSIASPVICKSILKYCDDFNLDTNEFYFDRQPRSFSSVIDFYRTGKLHLPDDLCVMSFKEDLDYWEIDDYNLDSCCQQRYHQRRDNVFEEMKKEMESLKEHDEELFGTSKLERYQKFVWDLLEKPQTSLAARVS